MDKEDIKWFINVLLSIVQIVLMIVLAKPKKIKNKKKKKAP